MNEVIMSVAVLGIGGLFFSLLLGFLSKKLSVQEDPRLEKILNILPGLNCGACGFSSCRVFAEEAAGKNKISSNCLAGGESINSLIPKVLGVEPGINRKVVAVCRCQAEQEEKKVSCSYEGPKTCKAADLIGGGIDCLYGCLGFGDCLRVCPTQAIAINKRKIYIDIKKCVGCGKCQVCPRQLFELIPLKEEVYYIACNNKEKGVNVKKVCSRGCIGCEICVKTSGLLFYLKDNLAFIDYKKKGEDKFLEEAKNKCPTKCIASNR